MVFDFTQLWLDGWPGNEYFWISHKIFGHLTPMTPLGVHPHSDLKPLETDMSDSSYCVVVRFSWMKHQSTDYFFKNSLKTTWTSPKNRWRTEKMNNKTLAKAIESEIHSYAKENLAIINIFIKEPSLKRFRKTEKMSRISYIASSGGLLGRVC